MAHWPLVETNKMLTFPLPPQFMSLLERYFDDISSALSTAYLVSSYPICCSFIGEELPCFLDRISYSFMSFAMVLGTTVPYAVKTSWGFQSAFLRRSIIYAHFAEVEYLQKAWKDWHKYVLLFSGPHPGFFFRILHLRAYFVQRSAWSLYGVGMLFAMSVISAHASCI